MKIDYDSLQPALSEKELAGVTRILFVTHLAIGDFVAMQNCFVAFKKAFPWIEIDIWVDEVRRTWKPWQVKKMKKSILHDWLVSTGLFGTVYDQTHSWGMFADSLKAVQEKNYSIVISFTHARTPRYARFARWMSPNGLVVALRGTDKRSFLGHFAHADRNVIVDYAKDKRDGRHISSLYGEWFHRLFGIHVATEPFITIPKEWTQYSADRKSVV